MGAEGQPVDQCRNQGVVLKQFRPTGERQIGGDDGAGPFAAVRDDLEEQLRFVFVETHVAELVQNQQIRVAGNIAQSEPACAVCRVLHHKNRGCASG